MLLRLSRPVLLFTLAVSAPVAAQTLRSDALGAVAGGALGFGSAVAVSEGTVFASRTGQVAGFPMPAAQKGAVFLYRETDGRWREAAQVTGRDVAIGDEFGAALAVDGTVLVVGAPGAAEGRGATYVFERNDDGAWVERAKLASADGAPGDRAGSSVALRGSVLVVGSPGRDSSRGAARVYRRSGQGAWAEQGRLPATLTPGDRFGSAIALTSERIVVGAPGLLPGGFGPPASPPRPGAAFVYRPGQGGAWQEDARLTAEGDTTVVSLGTAVLIDGQEVLLGSPMANRGAGAVIRFGREGNAWKVVGRIRAAAPERPAFFGAALVKDGGDLLVGAPLAFQQAGAVHVMRRGAEGWTEAQKFSVPAVGFGGAFGRALAASSGMAMVGAPTADFFEGAGHLYRREGDAGQWRALTSLVDETPGLPAVTSGEVKCENGTVRGFSCGEADLVSFLPVSAIGGKRGIMVNDIWGWTDPASGREFAIVGRLDGTSFVEVTDPANPSYIGELPLHTGARPALWRDIKVYKNHAFIVSDGSGPHGMQVFDLTQLLRVVGTPITFTETAHYNQIHSAHNIVIDTLSGFAFAVGSSMGGQTCGGALHMVDIRNPAQPAFAGCFADPATGNARTGYTHDAQCTVYRGPDTRYQGRQVCFNASETAIGIADVTDKTAPKALASASYPNVGYSHQGWLSDDQRHFFLNDELDELSGSTPRTRTIVWDVTNLEDPVVLTQFMGNTSASDHNLYVKGRYMYQSNYVAGLRIIDISDPAKPVEVAHFDTVPYGENAPGFAGSWSNYPYFKSGVVAVTSMREGLFLIRHRPRPVIP
jgi:choice-of-anchor B domain-containing protein